MYCCCNAGPKGIFARFAFALIFPILVAGCTRLPCDKKADQKQPVQSTPSDSVSDKKANNEQSVQPTPLDVASCTRVEVHYRPSVLEYFFSSDKEKRILSPTEMEYLGSLSALVVKDRQKLKILASKLSSGTYDPHGIKGTIATKWWIDVVCFSEGHRVGSLAILHDSVKTQEGHWFHFDGLDLESVVCDLTPEVRPLKLRRDCMEHLSSLRSYLELFAENKKAFSSPLEWCDDMVAEMKTYHYSEQYTANLLRCPEASEGKSHYAMNPKCKLHSPADLVLLFETKAGWNQHGGPELFTFDNHHPKGGMVVLNDGTVKFIRTEEELKQLRWK